jgi:hypothetical protein
MGRGGRYNDLAGRKGSRPCPMNKWNDDGDGSYIGLSLDDRKAIQALFHGTPEEALRRMQGRELPSGITLAALYTYERILLAGIRS